MKKKILLTGVVIALLVIAYFAGDKPATQPELMQESFQAETAPPVEEVSEKPTLAENLELQEQSEVEEPLEESTEPVELAEPVTPAEETTQEEKNICALSVECREVLSNMDNLAEGKEAIIPENGIFYSAETVAFSEGESVFDVLYRELRKGNIHFEFVKTPMYNSVYIEGIGNLYEFDCGDYSGWTYRVNGVKPNVGCSQYPVQPGDVITFSYTCNFLKDR